MKKSKSSHVLIAIVVIIVSLLYIDAMTDNPQIRVQKFAQESVVRSIAPYVD